MPENDQYSTRDGASKKPVLMLLVAVLAAGVGVLVYEASDPSRTTSSPAPSTGPTAANPNILVPPGSGAGSPTTP